MERVSGRRERIRQRLNPVYHFKSYCVTRSLSSGIHESNPEQMLHFDYLYLRRSSGTEKYFLVLKENLSFYCWLESVDSATSENAAVILSRWNRVITSPDIWISDKSSHFINKTSPASAEDYRILHQPTVAY